MTQAVVDVRNVVDRSGFANPLTLEVLVTDEDYLKVYADTTLLDNGTDYTITGIGDPNGVSIEIIGAEDVGNYVGIETFTAVYEPPLDQQGDLSAGGVLGRAFESALDQQNRRLQSIGDRVKRALKVNVNIDGDIILDPVHGMVPEWDEVTGQFVWTESPASSAASAAAAAASAATAAAEAALAAAASGDAEAAATAAEAAQAAAEVAQAAAEAAAAAAANKLPLAGGTMTGPIAFTHQASPANPAAGLLAVFAKNDERLYTRTSAGVEVALGSGDVIKVADRTALKALDTTKYTLAYLEETRRAGVFSFLSGDYSTQIAADTLEGVYVKADAIASTSGAWVRRREQLSFNLPGWWGAVGDNVADDTAALQACITEAQTSGMAVFLPKGTYKTTTALSVTSPILIQGAGPLQSTIYPAAGIVAISVDGTTGPSLRDFGIAYATVGTSGTAAIRVTSTASECGFFYANNIRINQAYRGFEFLKASQWIVDGCVVLDSQQTPLFVTNTNNVDSGDATVCNNLFFNPNTTGATHGMIWRSSGGLRVINNKFNNFQYGINFQLADGAVTGDFLVSGNSIEAVGYASVQTAISFQRLGTTGTFHSVLLTANQINGWAAGIQIADDATGPWLTGFSAIGNVVYGNTGAAASGIIIRECAGFVVSGNVFRSGAAGSRALEIAASASDGIVGPNAVTGSVVADALSGTTTTKTPSRYEGTATYDPANLADGAGATTTVTVTGAALGDVAMASFSNALQGITLTAWVSAADTVSVRFQNESGGALDLASGTLKAWVLK